jgi:hypothetical protein
MKFLGVKIPKPAQNVHHERDVEIQGVYPDETP